MNRKYVIQSLLILAVSCSLHGMATDNGNNDNNRYRVSITTSDNKVVSFKQEQVRALQESLVIKNKLENGVRLFGAVIIALSIVNKKELENILPYLSIIANERQRLADQNTHLALIESIRTRITPNEKLKKIVQLLDIPILHDLFQQTPSNNNDSVNSNNNDATGTLMPMPNGSVEWHSIQESDSTVHERRENMLHICQTRQRTFTRKAALDGHKCAKQTSNNNNNDADETEDELCDESNDEFNYESESDEDNTEFEDDDLHDDKRRKTKNNNTVVNANNNNETGTLVPMPDGSVEWHSNQKKNNQRNEGKKHKCTHPGCGKTFRDNSNLKKHQLIHTGQKPFTCTYPDCGKSFTQNSNLKKHQLIHTGQKSFTCIHPGCEKSFTHHHHLKSHQLLHTGEKPFLCTHPGCTSKFTYRNTLIDHKRIHTGERPFKCTHPDCGMSFSQNSNLKRHQRIHTREKPFVCQTCQRAFTWKISLKKHKCSNQPSNNNNADETEDELDETTVDDDAETELDISDTEQENGTGVEDGTETELASDDEEHLIDKRTKTN